MSLKKWRIILALCLLAVAFHAMAFSFPSFDSALESRQNDLQTLAREKLAEFDKELDHAVETNDTSWSLERSSVYKELLTIRSLLEHPEDIEFEPTADYFADIIQKASQKIDLSFKPGSNIVGNELPDRTWALTFDDGPHAVRTLQITKLLKAHKIKATFFWLARQVGSNKEIIKTVKAEGHSLQNHSFTHPNLTKASAFTLGKEISVSSAVQKEIYGIKPTFFRCPYGAGYDKARIKNLIAKEKMIHVLWSIDSLDWADKNSSRVAQRVLKQMKLHGRGIILLHDIQKGTPKATQIILSQHKKSNPADRWVTLPEIVK